MTKQLDAFAACGVERFEVGILPPKGVDGAPASQGIRQWDRAGIETAAAWLARQNARGLDIYIRPALDAAGRHPGLVFVDDLDRNALDRLRRDGLELSVPIESSPNRFHGWVRVSEQPITKEEATAAAKVIAKRYGGDVNAADWRHFGRLAGFTNRKPKYRNDRGHQPFARIHQTTPKVPAAAAAILKEARAHLAQQAEAKAQATRIAGRVDTIRRNAQTVPRDADSHYLRHAARLEASCTREGQTDWSRVDYGCAAELYKSGYEPKEIEGAILRNSPAVEQRHADPADYAQRTVQAAVSNPEVQTARVQHTTPSRGGRAPGGGGPPPPKPIPAAPEVGKRNTWADGETSRKL